MQSLTNFKNTYLYWFLAFVFCGISCAQKTTEQTNKNVQIAAESINDYLHLIEHKKIAIVGNQTSVLKNNSNRYIHLVDTLLTLQINIKKVFAPEHGFRGEADAGEIIKDGKDNKTGIPIISLYGKNKKPTKSQLANLDVVLFDIQDVGTRFYTYISTLHYVMEACAEQNIPVVVLDRPNPNAHYIDGPILELEHKSFVGMHPVPVVYGMTIGEYAKMINGQNWLANKVKCNLTVIPIKNYTHNTNYKLPVKPSPNLPNSKSINLYPSLCFFEGTPISVGRGTDSQFQVFGHPKFDMKKFMFSFTPLPNKGAKYPKHKNKICFGKNLKNTFSLQQLELKWLIEAYKDYQKLKLEKPFFNYFFKKLAGTKKLQQQIEADLPIKKIKESWENDLQNFKQIRKSYLLYK